MRLSIPKILVVTIFGTVFLLYGVATINAKEGLQNSPRGGEGVRSVQDAQNASRSTDDSNKFVNPILYDDFSAFVAAVIKVAVKILMPFVVLAFIWSGFLFVNAQGKEEKLKTAKSAIWWSVVGAFILLGAAGFAAIIETTIKTITK